MLFWMYSNSSLVMVECSAGDSATIKSQRQNQMIPNNPGEKKLSLRTHSHQAKTKANAKKSQRDQRKNVKYQRKILLSCSLLLGVNGP